MVSPKNPATPPIQRILFIGFGKVPGFHESDWRDWEWHNAADFETVFINSETLSVLLSDWKKQYDTDEEAFAVGPLVRLDENLTRLRNQLLQLITSSRAVYAFGVPDAHYQFDTHQGHLMTGRYIALSPYSWCPLPVDTVTENGQMTGHVDPRVASYRQQIKQWIFYFALPQRRLEHLEENFDLRRGEILALAASPLLENLSQRPLAIELRLHVLVGLKLDVLGNLRRLQNPEPTDRISAPIYLFHYPFGGDRTEAIRCLLREFCHTNMVVAEEPEWLPEFLPPQGKELNSAIDALSTQIDQMMTERALLAAKKAEAEKWRCLLYETGDALEDVVLRSLNLLGLQKVRFGPRGGHDIIGELA